ncbi:MAG: twitching motility protein PilT [Actinomycetota bacterium]|nr:twitching motility protein PilT [Actinomycetota bacterium]
MSALVLDAGAFLAVERDDRSLIAQLRVAQRHGVQLRSNAIVLAQVWRDSHGRQVRLARLLRGVDVRPVDDEAGRAAGVLIGWAGIRDPIDATLVLVAQTGDRILTSDPQDIQHLARAAGRSVAIIRC